MGQILAFFKRNISTVKIISNFNTMALSIQMILAIGMIQGHTAKQQQFYCSARIYLFFNNYITITIIPCYLLV